MVEAFKCPRCGDPIKWYPYKGVNAFTCPQCGWNDKKQIPTKVLFNNSSVNKCKLRLKAKENIPKN